MEAGKTGKKEITGKYMHFTTAKTGKTGKTFLSVSCIF